MPNGRPKYITFCDMRNDVFDLILSFARFLPRGELHIVTPMRSVSGGLREPMTSERRNHGGFEYTVHEVDISAYREGYASGSLKAPGCRQLSRFEIASHVLPRLFKDDDRVWMVDGFDIVFDPNPFEGQGCWNYSDEGSEFDKVVQDAAALGRVVMWSEQHSVRDSTCMKSWIGPCIGHMKGLDLLEFPNCGVVYGYVKDVCKCFDRVVRIAETYGCAFDQGAFAVDAYLNPSKYFIPESGYSVLHYHYNTDTSDEAKARCFIHHFNGDARPGKWAFVNKVLQSDNKIPQLVVRGAKA